MGREIAEAVPEAMEVYGSAATHPGSTCKQLCFEAPIEELIEPRCSSRRSSRPASRSRGAPRARDRSRTTSSATRSASSPRSPRPKSIGYGGGDRARARARARDGRGGPRERPGSMAAILGPRRRGRRGALPQDLGVWPANYNCPGQIVISGENDAVDECCIEAEREARRARAVKLSVSGAFHSPLVAKRRRAAQAGRREGRASHDPVAPFMSTVTAKIEAAQRLARAARRPAHGAREVHAGGAASWSQGGVKTFVEVGPGNVLSGLLKRIDRGVRRRSPSTTSPASKKLGEAVWSSWPSSARLEGKTALVTGGVAGDRPGDRRRARARGRDRRRRLSLGRRRRPRRSPSEIGGRAVQADVSDAEEAKRLVEEAGDLDILVNNAGLTRDGLLARMSDEDWQTVLDTNLASVFYTCRAVDAG